MAEKETKLNANTDETKLNANQPEVGNAGSLSVVYATNHITAWIGERGKTYIPISSLQSGGTGAQISYCPVPLGVTVFEGFLPGCMLATLTKAVTVNGVTLPIGAIVQYDGSAASIAAANGQNVWNGMVIIDQGLVYALFPQTITPTAGAQIQSYNGAINVATPASAWALRVQFMYAGTNPKADVALVQTAITAAKYNQYKISNGGAQPNQNVGGFTASGVFETIMAY